VKTHNKRAGLPMLAAITLTLGGCALPVADQPAIVVGPPTQQASDATPRPASPPEQRPTTHPATIPPHSAAATAPPPGEPAVLKPGQFTWHPERAPQGSVMVVVSLSDQRARVYRNGVLIGRTTVSTGRPDHETPTGVFTILQKQVQHASTLYNSAPMPYMERLTWDGVALHAGNLPGYPASHGCVRLPYEFSKRLYSVTASGTTVVISKAHLPSLTLSQPDALLAINAAARPLPAAAKDDYFWRPQRSPTGPLTVLLSSADRTMYVYRNGVLIGRAPVRISGPDTHLGSSVYKLLAGYLDAPSPLAPNRPARRWMAVGMSGDHGQATVPPNLAGRLRLPPAFAQAVYDQLTPGAVLMTSDQPASRDTRTDRNFVVMTSPRSAAAE